MHNNRLKKLTCPVQQNRDLPILLSATRIELTFVMAILLTLAWLLGGCQAPTAETLSQVTVTATKTQLRTSISITPTPLSLPDTPESAAPSTVTPFPTSTEGPTPSSTLTPTHTPSATPIGACSDRLPADDLLALVTLEYGLSRDYVPSNLVPISSRLPVTVTLGYPTQVRGVVLDPLKRMVDDMIDDGLWPQIISGYRSYSAQAIAWNKWLEKEPERASIVSAPPGHSEHQLGTTIDFGSQELGQIIGDDEVEFHTYFYKTSEGQWLLEHAHEYGFSLSFSREAFELTGLYYEPWHYRYIGPELATELKNQEMTLIESLLENYPLPCIP